MPGINKCRDCSETSEYSTAMLLNQCMKAYTSQRVPGIFNNLVKMENTEELPEWIPDAIKDHTEHKTHITQVFKVTNGLHKLQKNKTFCDITIKVEDTSFPAHKAVLAACSDFFTAMFMSGFQESHKAEVTVTGTPDAFQVLLNFAYSGKLELTMETAIDVLEMAHYIQFDDVVESCKSFLNEEIITRRVDTKDVVRIYSTADTLSLTKLVNSCKQNLVDIFKKLKPSEEFLEHVTAAIMEEILENFELTPVNLTDEERIFDTAVAWLQHHWEDRKQYAASFFQKIRLGVVPISHLSKTALFTYPNLYSVPECKELIDKVMEMVDPRKRKPNDPPLNHIDPSLFATRTTVNAPVFIAGNGHRKLYYDPDCDSTDSTEWYHMDFFPDLPKEDCPDTLNSCCNAQGHLYYAQGTGRLPRKLKCPQFLKLDMANNQWYSLAPMIERRESHPLVYMNGKIFAIGGGDDPASCEEYTISENRWQLMKPILSTDMNLGSLSCVAHERINMILVYYTDKAAQEGNQVEHILQMYNDAYAYLPRREKNWAVVLRTTHPFSSTTGLVVHGGKCYRVVGGNCTCKEKECKWHHDHIVVHELIIDQYPRSAWIGEEQDQRLIPAEFKKKAFCINQDVFVIVGTHYHKTGIKITRDQVEPVNLDMWKNMFTYQDRTHGVWETMSAFGAYGKFQFTSFMVDRALWEYPS
ncbi:kelch repeat and BTB domain-containing protein 2-like [Amphiura filiformis]|uniref:kelch repeat and BTB domain-containing protein 2-like n=1 Tax=Amphiura filiformis TaxID=82378 RepID=UPI003B222832